MRFPAIGRALALALCGAALLAPGAAQAAFDDPIGVYRPIPERNNPFPIPPPTGALEGPCGLAVGAGGAIYLSDYYHQVVDVFSSGFAYGGQVTTADPPAGPCGLAVSATGALYVNNFHRNVLRFAPGLGSSTVLTGVGSAEAQPTHPTGVAVDPASGNVYVDQRTHVSVFDAAGTELGRLGSFAEGYGIAFSGGLLYVPDAATDTVLVLDPDAADPDVPVATLTGAGTPAGHFTSLRNSAVAVDDTSGEVYVLDDLTPAWTSHHEGVVYVFSAAGAYEGRLKLSVDNALPAGLAVDNSGAASKGRVYVTSGNSEIAAVYVYAPHSATSNAVPLPEPPNFDPGSPEAPPSPLAAAPAPAALAPSAATAAQPSAAAEPAKPAAQRKRGHRKRAKKHGHRHRQAKGVRR